MCNNLFVIVKEKHLHCHLHFRLVTSMNERSSSKYSMIEEFPYHQKKVDRKYGLDVHRLKLVVAKLAKFHAATAFLYEDNEDLFDHHQQPNITTNFRLFHSLFETCFSTIADGFSMDDDKLRGKLQNFKHFMIERVSDALTLQNGEFGVLCHGDLWLDNLLFRYDDDDDNNEPIDVEMVRDDKSFLFQIFFHFLI